MLGVFGGIILRGPPAVDWITVRIDDWRTRRIYLKPNASVRCGPVFAGMYKMQFIDSTRQLDSAAAFVRGQFENLVPKQVLEDHACEIGPCPTYAEIVSAFLQFIANHRFFERIRIVIDQDGVTHMRQERWVADEFLGMENRGAVLDLRRKE